MCMSSQTYKVTAVVISDNPRLHEKRVPLHTSPRTYEGAKRIANTVNEKDHPYYRDARIEDYR